MRNRRDGCKLIQELFNSKRNPRAHAHPYKEPVLLRCWQCVVMGSPASHFSTSRACHLRPANCSAACATPSLQPYTSQLWYGA